jgi:hypothetical protein
LAAIALPLRRAAVASLLTIWCSSIRLALTIALLGPIPSLRLRWLTPRELVDALVNDLV